jgi:hypothetical protein
MLGLARCTDGCDLRPPATRRSPWHNRPPPNLLPLSRPSKQSDKTALHIAAYFGHLPLVNKLLAKGADNEAKDKQVSPPPIPGYPVLPDAPAAWLPAAASSPHQHKPACNHRTARHLERSAHPRAAPPARK